MSAPILLAFCAPGDRERVQDACPDVRIVVNAVAVDVRLLPRPHVLLAVGPEGGAALARWVDSHGVDGVACIVLVGVTAPCAERLGCDDPAHKGAPCGRPLPSLEPLRKVAERARAGEAVHRKVSCVGREFAGQYKGRVYPLRLVLAVAPDDGMCDCKWKPGSGYSNQADGVCLTCAGTGKALSSADVARELAGEALYAVIGVAHAATHGGLSVVRYPTSVALAEHGLAEALKMAVGPQ